MQKGEEMVSISRSEYDQLHADLANFKHQLKELQRLIYGSRSERFVADASQDQLGLFGSDQELKEAEEESQTITYDRKANKEKKSPVRALLPAHLPRE